MSLAMLSDPHPGADNIHIALDYAAAGIPVFPCWEAAGLDARGTHKDAKEPYTLHGFKDASTSEMQIRRWWKDNSHAIVGIACGAAGFFVIDCDVKGEKNGVKGPNGINNFTEIAGKLGIDLGKSLTTLTPSGGAHCYFAMPESSAMPDGKLPGSSVDRERGIDTRGSGGYVIAAGSVMADGTKYAPSGPDLIEARRDGMLPPLPDGLLAAVRPKKVAGKLLGVPAALPRLQPPSQVEPPHSPPGKRDFADADAALADECRILAATAEGGRNDTANRAAFAIGTFIAAGAIEEGRAMADLQAAAVHSGLTADEAAKAVGSGIAAGKLRPRVPRADRDPPLVDGVATFGAKLAAAQAATQAALPVTGQLSAALPPPAATIIARPFKLVDPRTIPLRKWLYSKHYIREFTSATIAPGGLEAVFTTTLG